ncbi:hypothetical protein E2C01_045899 [Portunus trituberculatus]|uniref:Uncharacterized protein n=1 Tax=Portunus trituberculatus TaxID=210409 RepID=A0A5B7G378_PORTR|nr:hypothetical protein [Portunus trituberculatus]
MADSGVRGSERPEDSEPGLKRLENLVAELVQAMSEMKQETRKIVKQEISEMKQETRNKLNKTGNEYGGSANGPDTRAVREARQFTLEHGKRLWQDLTEEFKEELVAVRQQCEGHTGRRVESKVEGRPCPMVVDTGVAKTVVREEVVAVQDLPVSDRQLCGVTGHYTML